jgi:hypothetical protein
MAKLVVQNMSWPEERYQKLAKKLAFLMHDLNNLLSLKNPVIIHLYENKDKDKAERGEYDEGVIILYEATPDWRGDFIHELSHQLIRYKDVSITQKKKLEKIQKNLEKNKGDGRIFIQSHTYSSPREMIATYFKWYILGKVIDPGYLEVLNNYQPQAVTIIEKILKLGKIQKSTSSLSLGMIKSFGNKKYEKVDYGKWKLLKAKKMPIGTVSKGRKKIAEGKWVPLKKEKDSKSKFQAIYDKEKEIYKNEKETVLFVDSDGSPLFEKTGSEKSVSFHPAELSEIRLSSVATHNHPGKGSKSFSNHDIYLTLNYGIKEMRVISKKYLYIFKVKEDYHDFSELDKELAEIGEKIGIRQKKQTRFNKSKLLYERADSEVRGKLEDKVYDESISVEEANNIHGHEVMKKFVDEAPEWFEYKRLENPYKEKENA